MRPKFKSFNNTVVCKDIMITITYSVVQNRLVYTLVDKCLKQSLKVLSTHLHLHISDMAYKHTSKFQGLEYLFSKD